MVTEAIPFSLHCKQYLMLPLFKKYTSYQLQTLLTNNVSFFFKTYISSVPGLQTAVEEKVELKLLNIKGFML